ncbi:MAG: 23S rRNA pseudouridine(1911/1915/1917) synthase RluD [Rhodocyclaceae bacterium]
MNASNSNRADYIAPPPRILEIPADCAGLRLDQALARLLPEHSRSRLAAWVKQGKVSLDDTAADARRKVWGGERVAIAAMTLPEDAAQQPEAIPLAIVFEDAHILVVDKPAGLVVHPGSGNWQGTLLNALLHHAPHLAGIPRAGIVHRLDKDTSGLLVVAKTLEAQTDLVRQLAARSVKRLYLALAHGRVVRDGVVDAPIGRHPVRRTRMAVVGSGRAARTHYRVLERFTRATLLECALETGRTHQIRVHMTQLGHPLVGDPVYGPRRKAQTALADFPRQALHAWRLALTHPATREEVAWEAPLPDDFSALLDSLRAETT